MYEKDGKICVKKMKKKCKKPVLWNCIVQYSTVQKVAWVRIVLSAKIPDSLFLIKRIASLLKCQMAALGSMWSSTCLEQ